MLKIHEMNSCYLIAIKHSTDNTKIPILHVLFLLHFVSETRFTTDDFANFCSKNFLFLKYRIF